MIVLPREPIPLSKDRLVRRNTLLIEGILLRLVCQVLRPVVEGASSSWCRRFPSYTVSGKMWRQVLFLGQPLWEVLLKKRLETGPFPRAVRVENASSSGSGWKSGYLLKNIRLSLARCLQERTVRSLLTSGLQILRGR